jgi:hypothetical protein
VDSFVSSTLKDLFRTLTWGIREGADIQPFSIKRLKRFPSDELITFSICFSPPEDSRPLPLAKVISKLRSSIQSKPWVVTFGPQASGKSTVGLRAAEQGWLVYDIDTLREQTNFRELTSILPETSVKDRRRIFLNAYTALALRWKDWITEILSQQETPVKTLIICHTPMEISMLQESWAVTKLLPTFDPEEAVIGRGEDLPWQSHFQDFILTQYRTEIRIPEVTVGELSWILQQYDNLLAPLSE